MLDEYFMSYDHKHKIEAMAVGIFHGIDEAFRETKFVESMLEKYSEFYRGTEGRRLNISEKPITRDTFLRLQVECLCYCTSVATRQSKFLIMRTKSFLNLRFDLMLSFHFNRIIKTNLGTRCIKLGTHKLYDDTTDPDKINDSLNLLGKLLKYSNADNCYRELELFGTSLGTIIDPKLKTIIDSKKLRTVYADWYESGKFFK